MTHKIRKGDVVAVHTTETTYYVHGSRPSESRECWRLAVVASATRDGKEAKSLQIGDSHPTKLEHMSGKPKVWPIQRDDLRAQAARLREADKGAEWDSKRALQEAIVAA
jgi:hypothetical protein